MRAIFANSQAVDQYLNLLLRDFYKLIKFGHATIVFLKPMLIFLGPALIFLKPALIFPL